MMSQNEQKVNLALSQIATEQNGFAEKEMSRPETYTTMNEIETAATEKIIRRFFTHVYDEWVTGVDRVDDLPTITASICRALSAATGKELFDRVLRSLVADERVEILKPFEEAQPNEPALKLLDYSL